MNHAKHETYLKRCLQLAKLGIYTAAPNPLVGAVIVHKEVIIGEGFHHHAGAAHAEVKAIEAVAQKSLLPESTLYVNLEPCSHHGRTPPCAHRIVQENIPRVVIGCRDHSAKVNGRGIAHLQEAGVEVTENVLREEAEALNAVFFTSQLKQRPFITLKWAQTSDGFMDKKRAAGETGSFPISGKASRVYTHQLRAQHAAILVGAGTALNDEPQLNVRYYTGQNPVPVLWDPHGKVPEQHPLRRQSDSLYFTFPETEKGLGQLLDHLQKRHLTSLLVEGGAHTLRQFIKFKMWDAAKVITAPHSLSEGLAAPAIAGSFTTAISIGKDTVHQYAAL